MTRGDRRLLQLQRWDRWCLERVPDLPYAAVLLLLVVFLVALLVSMKGGVIVNQS